MHPIDLDKLIPAERIVGDDAEDTGLLQQTLQEATDYLKSFRWCPPVEQIYLGCGVGGVVAASELEKIVGRLVAGAVEGEGGALEG